MPETHQAREVGLPWGRLRFRQCGSGPDLVLLHGLLGCAAQWDAVRERLAQRFRCWALELPGVSFSDPPADLSLAGLAAWLQAALAELGIKRCTLAGSSWGGAVALAYALGREPRCQRLVLAAPAHPCWRLSRGQRFLMRPWPARCGAWLGARSAAGVWRHMLARSYADPRRIAAAQVDDYGAILRQPGLGAAVAGYGRGFTGQQRALQAELGRNTIPTLLVWGDQDAVVPTRTAAALQAALPHSQLVVLPGCGHIPFAEAPEAFLEALLPFLH